MTTREKRVKKISAQLITTHSHKKRKKNKKIKMKMKMNTPQNSARVRFCVLTLYPPS